MTESGAAGEEYQYATSGELQADGTWRSSGSALSQEWRGNDFGYGGSGSYAHSEPGGSVSGTLTSSGGGGGKYHRETTSTLPTGGSWQHVTTEGSEYYASNEFGYSGSGKYSRTFADGSVSGTIEEGASRGTSSYYGYEQKLGSSGWELTCATCHVQATISRLRLK